MLAGALLVLELAPAAAAPRSGPKAAGKERSLDSKNWGGRRWSAQELNLFQGRPQMATDGDTNRFVLVAYSRFVSYYDLLGRTPRWVAYVTDQKSAVTAESGSRTGPAFARPREFFTDKVIAKRSQRLGVKPVVHADFSDRVPEGLPPADAVPRDIPSAQAQSYPAIIERGHLAPNSTMKNWGTEEQGRKAQYESFSLANVVAQMRAHNAPTWSALEAQCLAWAKELGTVCVIAGPIHANPEQPRHLLDRQTGTPVDIPVPDALFCVVIGRREGKIAAIGFIMPHLTAPYSFRKQAVPIDKVEQATGINFMPLLNEPNPLEETVDLRWMDN